MNDFSEVERAMTEMSQAAGSSDKEMEIIEQSIDYKINAIKQSWVGFLQDVLKREDLGKLFDALLKGSESLQKTLSTLTPVIVPLVEALAKLIDMFAELNESTNGLAGVAALVFGGFRVKSKFDGVRGIFSSLLGGANISEEAAPFTKKFTDFFTKQLPLETANAISKSDAGDLLSKALLTGRDYGDAAAEAFAQREAKMSLKELDALAKGTPKTTTAFKNLFKVTADGTGKFGAFAANLGMSSAALAGIIAAAVAAAYAIYKLSTAQSEINKHAKEAYDSYNEQTKSLENYQAKVQELRAITDDSTKSIEEQQAAREELLTIQSEMIDQFGVEAGKIDVLRDSVDSLNSSFETLKNNKYQEFLNNVNDTGFWETTYLKAGGFSDAMDSIVSQMEASTRTIDLFGEGTAKRLEKAFEKLDIKGTLNEEIDSFTGAGTGSYYVSLANGSLQSNYEAILKLQEEFKNDTYLSDILREQANTIKETLDEIGDSYNTYLEHEVIFPKYGEQVSKIKSLMSSLHTAQIKNDEEEVERLSKELTEAYESIYKNGEIDETSRNWFENLVKEYQGIIDRQEFIMKIKPVVATDESKEYQKKIKELKESGLSQSEILEKVNIAKDHSDAALSQMGWSDKIIELIRYLQRLTEENPISLEFILDEEKVSKLSQEIMDLIGDSYNKLSEEDQKIVSSFSTKQIKDEISYIKNKYPEINNSIEITDKALDSLIAKTKKIADNIKEMTFSDAIDELSKLEGQFDTVDKAFAELFDKDDMQVDLSSIKAIKDAFKEIDENFDFSTIEDELNSLLNATNTEEAQESVDGLISKFIEESKILESVDDSNKDLIASQLELMGVENAEEIVLAALEGRKDAIAAENQFLEQTGRDVTTATYDEITAFLQENEVSESTRQHLAQLALEKISVNENKIKTDDDCQQLLNLANAAMASETAIAKVKELKAILSDSRAGSTRVEWAQQQLNAINNGTFDWGFEKNKIKVDDIQVPKAHYTGGKATKAAQKAAEKSGKESAETFDWLETKIQRCEESIQRFDKTVNASYKAWSKRNGAIASELDKVREKINLQATAYQVYMQKANSIGLSEHYKNLVKNGGLVIEDIADENLKKMINDFKTFYEKAIQAKDAIEDLNAQLTQLAKAKFDNVKSEFEGFTSEIEHFSSLIDKQLSHVENIGKIAGKSFYNAQMEQNNEKLNKLYQEREALLQSLREAEANGVEAGSADWLAMRNDIYSVDEAIADLTYSVEELKKKLKEVAKLNFDDLKSQFENALGILNDQKSLTDAVVSMVEESGHIASRAYYESLVEGSKATVTGLRKEYERLTSTLAEALSSGDIEEYSKEWYEMKSDIDGVKQSLIDAANATISYANALRQIDWDIFDRTLNTIGKLTDETEFFIELLSYQDLFNKDTAEWTEAGIATRGLMVEKYQVFVDQANAYGKEAEKIKELLELDPKNVTLIDRYYDLIEAQRQALLNSKEEKKAVEDLYKNAYDNLLERIKKLIDEYKKALNAAKNLYDFENTIEEKNQKINDLRKQLLAYDNGNDTSEENRATVQRLNTELGVAQKDLEQTEYDKYIQDQQELLDEFYTTLEEWLNGRLDEIEGLFEQAIEDTNLNGQMIDNTLHEVADSVNYQMTDEFLNIWDSFATAYDAANSISDGIATVTQDILSLTHDTTDSIRYKMDELPTDANLERYFDGVDLDILRQISTSENNTNNMINAIDSTARGIDNVNSNIVELSNVLGNKIDYAGQNVSNAINSLEFSTGGGGYDTPGGGNYNTGSSGGSSNSYSDPNTGKKFGYKIDGVGTLFSSPNDAEQRLERDAENAARKAANRAPTSEKDAVYQRILRDYMSGHRVVSGYFKRGGIVGDFDNPLDAIAKLLGEDHMVAAKEGERILTEEQNENFEKMVNANFTPLDADTKDRFSMLNGLNSKDITNAIPTMPAPNVGNVSNVGNSTTVGEININLPNVTKKEEFVQWLKNDDQLENIIQAMTIQRLAGGNSYSKMRY